MPSSFQIAEILFSFVFDHQMAAGDWKAAYVSCHHTDQLQSLCRPLLLDS